MSRDAEKLRNRRRAAIISVVVGTAMFAVKMGAYILTGSAAIFSDALESVVHVFATGFALYSVILSARPADKSHPYGHGKVEFFSAGFEGALIILAAISIFYTAVPKLFTRPEIQHLNIGTGAIALAGLVNLALGLHLIAVGRKEGSLTLVADGRHVLTDSYTSIGVVFGLGLVLLTGWKILDPIAALAVALNILFTGSRLVKESISGLMDAADESLISHVVEALNQHRRREWIDIHRLRCWRSGEVRHLDLHLTLPYYMEVAQAHDNEKAVERILAETLDGPVQLLIHHDPCVPSCCSFCAVESCAVRKSEMTEQMIFTPQQVVGDAPYLDDAD